MEITTVNYKRHSPKEHREALHEELTHTGDYTVAAGALRCLHPFLYSFMQDLTTNTYDAEKYHKRKGHDEQTTLRALDGRDSKRGAAYEMILSQLQRLRSEHNAPFLTVLKSMVAFRQGLNFDFWKAECALKGMMSYQWTHDFVVEMSKRPTELPFKVAKTVAFVVYDNCDYHRKKSYDRTDDKGEYIKTVQMVQVPVDSNLGEVSAEEVGERLAPFARTKYFKKITAINLKLIVRG